MKPLILPNKELLREVELQLSQGQPVRIHPRGHSMFPFIREDSDEIILSPIDSPRVGQIVMAHLKNERYVVHRIIAKEGSNLVLMGDGNVSGTEECTEKEIIGKVDTVIRNGRRLSPESRWEQQKSRFWLILRPLRKYVLYVVRYFCS